jgi:hypothetical protein
VKYELGFYIPEDAMLHSHCRENLRSYKVIAFSFVGSREEKRFLSNPVAMHDVSCADSCSQNKKTNSVALSPQASYTD